MGLINKDFNYSLPDNFGTENVSLFLYSLIKCCRPQSLLEIGAGYSTFFITEALKDIINDINNENNFFTIGGKKVRELDLDFWKQKYKPYLDIVENGNEIDLNKVRNKLLNLNLDKFVNIINQDIYKFRTNKKYDLIWIDFGDGDQYLYFFEKFLTNLSENGIIIIHSTLTNLWGKLFETEIKLRIQKGIYPNLELVSFLEPHKPIQNSFTIIKKVQNPLIHTICA